MTKDNEIQRLQDLLNSTMRLIELNEQSQNTNKEILQELYATYYEVKETLRQLKGRDDE